MADEKGEGQGTRKKGKLPLILGGVGGLVVIQAAVFFFVFKSGGAGPSPTFGKEGSHAVEPAEPTSQPVTYAEVALVRSFRVPNNKSGRTYIYDFDISVLVPAAKKEEIEKFTKERSAEIADALTKVIRAAETRVLNEDDFRTLRAHLLRELADIAQDEKAFHRVLIPHCVALRAE